jgi:hypothetical protein
MKARTVVLAAAVAATALTPATAPTCAERWHNWMQRHLSSDDVAHIRSDYQPGGTSGVQGFVPLNSAPWCAEGGATVTIRIAG